MYHIAICDDDYEFIQALEKMIRQSPSFDERMIFHEYSDGRRLLEDSDFQYDLVFMDMQYGELDGYQVASELRKRNADFVLAFCTGVQVPQAEHFTVQPFRYLLKDDAESMQRYICDLLTEMKKLNDTETIFLPQGGTILRFEPDEILYIERTKRGSLIHLNGVEPDKVPCNIKLPELYTRLKENGFEYPHNSYIVNLRLITSITRDTITLINQEELNISRSRADCFKERFSQVLSIR
ncbi:MAG: LytTR family DNA-binding domain-containing protein [bacterium]|nr:LytTR family DNA-binding domain-containing protein [bacterium]